MSSTGRSGGAGVRAAQAVPAALVGQVAQAEPVELAAQCLARLADVYANPIMVDALILGREGTIVVPEIRRPTLQVLRAGIADDYR